MLRVVRALPLTQMGKAHAKFVRQAIHGARSYHHIAVIGTGPSAFYTAKYCLDLNENVRVDLFEKLPTPYGLVRSGVAPDHPEVKTVEETFTQVAECPRVRLFANVEVGEPSYAKPHVVPIQDIMKSYSGVVLAYGASSDMALNIPGEGLPGVISSRSFVNWYNGHPDFATFNQTAFDLSKVEHVVVVGQGNVALDCARILSKHSDDLAETDISTTAHDALCRSNVKSVTVIGRRGHIQSAFTIKELRELTRMRGVKVLIDNTELALGRTEASMKEIENNRPKKRIVELIESISLGTLPKTDTATEDSGGIDRSISIKYLVTPLEAVSDPSTCRVSALKVVRNKLTGAANQQKAVPLTPESDNDSSSAGPVLQSIPCDLLIKSVGYKCESISPAIPFSKATNTVPSSKGRALSTEAGGNGPPLAVPGLYVTGWLKRGATGIIASNIPDAKETAAAIGEDIKNGLLNQVDDALVSNTEVCAATDKSSAPHPQLPWMSSPTARALFDSNAVVSWPEYLKIQTEETRRGTLRSPPKLREKILDKKELLTVAKASELN